MHRFGLAAFVVLGILVSSIASATIPESPATSSATPSGSRITLVVPTQPIATYIPPAASAEASVTRIFSYNGGGFENLALRSQWPDPRNNSFPCAPSLLYRSPPDPAGLRPPQFHVAQEHGRHHGARAGYVLRSRPRH